MAQISEITNYYGVAVSRQLQQYRDLPRMNAILLAYSQQAQDLENAMYMLFTLRTIQNILPATLFPVVVAITTSGVLGVMQYTYQLGSAPPQGPYVSGAANSLGQFVYEVPGSILVLQFSATTYTSGWSYSISSLGAITPAGGGGTELTLGTSNLLAKLGSIVGQQSLGLRDPQYLYLIQARIRVDRSNSILSDLIRVSQLLDLNVQDPVKVRTLPFTTVYIEPEGPIAVNPYIYALAFLAETVAAGVWMVFVWSLLPRAHSILFGSVYVAGFAVVSNVPTGTGVSASQSLGSVYNPGFAVVSNVVTNTGGGALFGVIDNAEII